MKLQEMSVLGRRAADEIRNLPAAVRNQVLQQFSDLLEQQQDAILQANAGDLEDSRAAGLSAAMLDRLALNEERIHAMAEGVREIAALPDPLNRILEERTLRSGLRLQKITVPFGLIGIIFESRPNVTSDCAALCFKAGSAVILKGGRESSRSSAAIVRLFHEALRNANLSPDDVQLAARPTHEEVEAWISSRDSLDLLIPRGSRRLIQSVVSHARVPVIETGAGICHCYIERDADLDMAERIVINAKTSRPSVCNAMETLLVQADIAPAFLPRIVTALQAKGVREIYGNEAAVQVEPRILPAKPDSFDTEYDDLIMNAAVVKDVQAAAAHIAAHGTHHSETIVTASADTAAWFMNHVDSACVYRNASTRFTDGFEFGLGAEIGISTQKLHARGPMALQEITTYTFHIEGDGQIR